MQKYSLVADGNVKNQILFHYQLNPNKDNYLVLVVINNPYYYIMLIEQSINKDFAKLHVQKFTNKLSAINFINAKK